MLIVHLEIRRNLTDAVAGRCQDALTHSATPCIAVRAALPGDRDTISAMLGAAFQNDPVMSFIFPDAAVRRTRVPRLFAISYEADGAGGMRYMTCGGEAAALWRAPGRGRLSFREKLALCIPWLATVGSAFGRALAVSAASDANHPAEPHWYLDVAGCLPDAHGRGFGGAAIRAGLARADADRIATYAETANERNVGIYNALGFRVTHCWKVPDGPMHWSMLRVKAPQIVLNTDRSLTQILTRP